MNLQLLPKPVTYRRCIATNDPENEEIMERILTIYEHSRISDLDQFKKDCDNLISLIKKGMLLKDVNGQTFITIKILVPLLKKCSKALQDFLTIKVLIMMMTVTKMNRSIRVDILESLLSNYLYTESMYIKILKVAENNKEISIYQLQDFVSKHFVPMMKQLPEKNEYYSAYVAGIIFFILDSRKKDCILLQDLLTSNMLGYLESCIQFDNDESETVEEPILDIFTLKAFQNTLEEFRMLNTNKNGVLSAEEMMLFRFSYFNTLFINRVFEISLTYERGFLDFKGFVDLITAIRLRHMKASIRYHFEAFDLKNDGVIDEDEIRHLCLTLQECIPQLDIIPETDLMVTDMKDLMKYKEPMTLEHVLSCPMKHIFTGYLSNFPDWIKYERREH